MEEDYDLVIFDSPPVNPVADALVLGSLVDACLVVVRAERTSRHALRAALRSLQAVSVGITGAVLNHRESARGKSYGYGRYGYGTDYGYGEYGYRYPDDKQPASAEA